MANFDNDITLRVSLDTEDIINKADQLDNELDNIFNRSARSTKVSTAFMGLEASMARLAQRSQQLRDEMDDAFRAGTDNAGNWIDAVEHISYERMVDQLHNINNQLTILRERVIATGEVGNLGRLTDAFARLRGAASATWAQLRQNPLPMVGGAFVKLASNISKAAISVAKFTVSKTISGIKSLASHATKAANSLAKMAGSGIKKGITSLGNAIRSLGKHTKSSNNMLQVGFKQFLRYGLGMRSVFTLIRKLRSALAEGLENLGNYDTEFGSTITRFKEALETLKNSFASAFAPVIQVVLPILTQFIEKLSSVVSLVGKFIAALTGKTSFTQATRAQKQYKKAVDATGKSVKEAKRELYGFDEITKQQDDSASNNAGSGSSGPDKDDIVGGFKTVPIEGWLKDLADKIRNFFKSKDWVGLGTFLGESINKVFQKAKDFLDNPALLNKIYEVIDAITTTFNSLVSAINWPLIGSTFASGINLIVNAADRLITGIDWKNIGKSIADGLNSLFKDIDWEKLGKTIGDALSIIPQMLSNFYATIDWKALGENLAKGLNSMINSIDWDSVSGWVSNKINALFSVIGGFVRTFDWKGTASKIANALNNMVKNINWAEVGKVVSDAMIKIFNGISQFLKDVDWKQIGEKVKEFLVNIDWAGVMEALFDAIGAALGGLAAFLWGLIEDAWNSVVDWFKDATKDGGKEVISGLFNGIVEALKNVGQWIKDHIFKPFIDGFKKAFGIASPSKEMAKMGTYVIQGLLNGVATIMKNIGSWIKEHIFGPIKNGLSTVFGIAGGIARNVVEVGKSIVGGIKNGASGAWNTVSSVFSKGVDNIKALFKVDWVSVGATVVRGINNGVTNLWGNVTGFFSRAVSNIKSFFLNTNWYNIGINICAGIRNGLSNGVNAVVNAAKSVAKRAFDAAKRFLGIRSPSTVFRDKVGKMISSGLALGIDDNASKAINSVGELGKSITSEAMGIKVPAIAAGNVVPYSSTNNSTTAQNSVIDSMLTKLAPIIQSALMNAISESDGFDVNFSVNSDPNKIFTVVREQGLNYQRMTGKPVFD